MKIMVTAVGKLYIIVTFTLHICVCQAKILACNYVHVVGTLVLPITSTSENATGL